MPSLLVRDWHQSAKRTLPPRRNSTSCQPRRPVALRITIAAAALSTATLRRPGTHSTIRAQALVVAPDWGRAEPATPAHVSEYATPPIRSDILSGTLSDPGGPGMLRDVGDLAFDVHLFARIMYPAGQQASLDQNDAGLGSLGQFAQMLSIRRQGSEPRLAGIAPENAGHALLFAQIDGQNRLGDVGCDSSVHGKLLVGMVVVENPLNFQAITSPRLAWIL